MRAILIVGDGLADRPVPQLKNKTPLETARKPSLNRIAETGICGVMDPIAPGVPPGSDTATLALLGYDPMKVYSGRGALEALGSGVEVLPHDVVFRCNFATVDNNLNVVDRRAGRIETSESSKLAEAFEGIVIEGHKDVQITFKNTIQHRAILRLRGRKLSRMVSDSDPQKTGTPILTVNPQDDSSEAMETADIVNKFTHCSLKILKTHAVNARRIKKGLPPANIILCRGAGKLPMVTPISILYGIRGAAVCVMPLIRGVCKVAGLSLLDIEGATGAYDTDVIAKAKAAVQALKSHDFVFVHVKATDVASHDGKAEQKIRMIEKIDNMARYILERVSLDEILVAITTDHTTSLVTREHEGDPVPVAITGPGVRTDDVKEFDERNCARGGLGRIRGKDLMPIIMNLMGKTKKFGA